ncbi:hypothetical protein [Amycolatopsis kentuckyensis]|uniref:hypothetical protein n=1 Tax=Amycolatopsis kentuckyensis TaxID=218823 RepID=UPI000A3A0D44|nr:hypothetical protein [Amycolatopsis kentuckyensis]
MTAPAVARERRRIARLPVSRCAHVTGPGPRLCAVEGRTEPGPAGTLIAPLSGEPCVWFFTGSVLVDGRLLHPDHPSSRVDHRSPLRRVVGEDVRSARDPLLGAARRRHLVSGRTREQLAADIDQDVRTGSGCLLLGTIAGPLLFLAGYLLVMRTS